MRCLRVGMAQINPVVGDLTGNRKKILHMLKKARTEGIQLLAFPELAVTGYPPKDLLLKPKFIRKNIDIIHSILPETKGICVIIGYVDLAEDLYNAAAILHDGQWIGTQHKICLPNYDVFDENRYFQAGTISTLYDLDCTLFGVNICEDIWFPGGPTMEMAKSGAEIIINISASPFHAGKGGMRKQMISTRAKDNLVFILFDNLTGGQDDLVFDGRSMIANPEGRIITTGPSFAEGLVAADLNLSEVRQHRLKSPRNRRSVREAGMTGNLLPVIVSEGKTAKTRKKDCRRKSDVRANPFLMQPSEEIYNPYEEVYAALRLGLNDYVRKNNFKKVIIGISGGIDSALTAALAVDALGASNVVGVAMPSGISSPESLDDARTLAENLHFPLKVIPIEEIFETFLAHLADSFRGTKKDTTEENIQARIRGVLLMALSNKFGYLVLSTGNKSEVAVGYATLYGDMAGGLAVLSDVPKTLVYKLADYRNGLGKSPVIPRRILTKPPSAELAPGQKDSDTLPEYDILDGILHAYIERDESAEEITARGYDKTTVHDVIRRVDRNEYKRQQAAPGIRITPRAFGSGRRLPITNKYRG
ncbi:MAG: NAD+ synthase [Deltaproteobacteria bacterium]|nr:NAD+ synthase [Deltaproteobacteria bacterium]